MSSDLPRPAGEPRSAQPAFELVFRGYDREQVAAELGRQEQVIEQLKAKLTATEQGLRHTTQQLRAIETARRSASEEPASAAGPSGFGPRAEKLLRLAESEAADIRSQAVRDASELMERSRAEAELQRHAVEQALIARAREFEELAARRDAECQDREDQIARRLSAAQAEADRIAAAAQREAERLREEVEVEVEALRSRIQAESDQMREQARLDVDQLHEVRAATWGDIERIADRINAELARDRQGARSAGFSGAGPSALPDRGNVLDAGVGRSTT
jgi:hypothetical protein